VSEAYRTGNLTREQATKILIDNGWASPAPSGRVIGSVRSPSNWIAKSYAISSSQPHFASDTRANLLRR
jgi:hypothetical protein